MAMEGNENIITWLLKGDPSVRWQALRDLMNAPRSQWEKERRKVAAEGWGAKLLSHRNPPDGRWCSGHGGGGGLYTPKWTSTTYTLLLLYRLGLPPGHPAAVKACRILLDEGLWKDGGINLSVTVKKSETCITGMILSLGAYFRLEDPRLEKLARYLLKEQMEDGGWNCQKESGAVHSSLHTTISVLEGLMEYARSGGDRLTKVRKAEESGREFLLAHRLFRSHRTGEIIDPAMTRFSFPPRWHYDILRALDYFQASGADRDGRLDDAIAFVEKRRKPDGRWILQNRHPGRSWFEMEKTGRPSRWNTLRALRVLKWWENKQS